MTLAVGIDVLAGVVVGVFVVVVLAGRGLVVLGRRVLVGASVASGSTLVGAALVCIVLAGGALVVVALDAAAVVEASVDSVVDGAVSVVNCVGGGPTVNPSVPWVSELSWP